MGLQAHLVRGRRACRTQHPLRARTRGRKAIQLFAALVFLLGALAPVWHQARAKEFAPDGVVQLQSLFGLTAEELRAAVCEHEDGSAPDLPDRDGARFCKRHCALLLAAQQHAPAFMPDGLAWPARNAIAAAAFSPNRCPLKASRELFGQGRPRASPLS
jgi:hypothetical protein